MSKKKVRVEVLCEGVQDEVFIRKYLIGAGFDRRKIHYDVSPKGKGSGEDYVKKKLY